MIPVTVSFFSYFRSLAGCDKTELQMADGATLGNLVEAVGMKFPRLQPMRRSTLCAVGLDYQDAGYALKPGDQVSLFPPVQGG